MLAARYYVDADVLRDESESIFTKAWQLAGRAEQVREPGQFFTTHVANEPLLVVRGTDGVLRAMSNVCRHRAGPVAKGEGKRPVLQCGYHGWTYALDGRVLSAPEIDDVGNVCLPQFRIEEWNELLFVAIDRTAPTLSEFLGTMIDEMPRHDYRGFRLAARKDWEIACNWKVYVDNYLEGYHIPIVHPGLFKEIDYPNYRTETKKNYSIQFAPAKRSARIRTTADQDEVRYFWLFPNLMLNVYPDNFSTNLIVPLGQERTMTIFDWYFRDPDDAATQRALADTIAFSDEIQIEDIAICEAVQRGLRSSTYTSGPYAPRENGVRHFHRLYAAAMGITSARP